MNKAEMFWQTYLNLEKELLDISKYVYITDEINDNQLKVYSPHFADLLVRTCIEIEAISKELYFDFGGKKLRGDTTLMFDTDCLKLIDQKCGTHKKIVMITCPLFNLVKEPNKIFRPLKESHKPKGTDWERAYQAVKHDRYSSIKEGTLLSFIHAMGALYLLNIYYKDIKLSCKYLDIHKLDLSLGSSIFSVKKPDEKYVTDAINNIETLNTMTSDDSPFILKYVDSTYKEVIETNRICNENRKKYLFAQPELYEPEFNEIIKKGLQREKENPRERFIIFWELAKYRLNKKIPQSLPFEERKKLFISSEEWNGHIRNINKHLTENELTEENIQSEIDHAAIDFGIEIEQQFERPRMQKAFYEGLCELVLDKGDIKYN